MEFWEAITRAYEGYASYLWDAITHPLKFPNGFYFLMIVSLVVFGLELAFPWRKKQRKFRKDFWQDAFYMFFNYFLFQLIVFAALTKTTRILFGKLVGTMGLPTDYLLDFSGLPGWLQFVVYFLLYDFVQWSVHVILHRVPFLWEFHKVHHSVREMGFAAHLRFHFMESVVYQIAKFTLLAYIFNFKLTDAFYIYFFATLIGHLNHANLGWDYGPLKYILNNPKMHIWHHAKELPADRPYGMNYAITLSVWDYIFRTNYIPKSGRDIELGFENVENYPTSFWGHVVKPFKRR